MGEEFDSGKEGINKTVSLKVGDIVEYNASGYGDGPFMLMDYCIENKEVVFGGKGLKDWQVEDDFKNGVVFEYDGILDLDKMTRVLGRIEDRDEFKMILRNGKFLGSNLSDDFIDRCLKQFDDEFEVTLPNLLENFRDNHPH